QNARRGLPPTQVAEGVWRALTSPNPKARYLIAHPSRARQVWLLRLLPTPLRDRLIARVMGIQGPTS
ncbi:MAG: corticosteroid 11-beta-dehydrogenase, partial [Thermus sp.]